VVAPFSTIVRPVKLLFKSITVSLCGLPLKIPVLS
jgi:hypothetical protein